jgi:hypothetical protein
MSAIDDLANRIETNLKATDAPGMDVRFTMDRAAATAFLEQLRATARLLDDHEHLRAENENLRKCGSCGEPLSRDCPHCKRLCES